MMLVSPKKASKYFRAKLDFTTGPIELNKMILESENIHIIDVRAREDFAKGHIPNAINLPKGTWGDLSPLSRDRVNIVYCYSEVCHLAAQAAVVFAEHGYSVMELEGGFEVWQHYELPIES